MSANPKKPQKLKPRLPKGLPDRASEEIAATREMTERIRRVYERYGFDPVETPTIEYTDALGKFLPDQDRPNEGVFSFQDEDGQWLSLRYDLTAPLARYVAERYGTENLVLPYRSYRAGYVYRNEKPGPGRFRQFMQFDADTVGSASPAADAEMCMMAADTMEELGIPRGQYVVKVNNRKLLDGLMDLVGLSGDHNTTRRLNVLRALDKYDRLGVEGVRALLGKGREDESGDYSHGAHLSEEQIDHLMMLFQLTPQSPFEMEGLQEWEWDDSSYVDVQLDPYGRLVRQIYSYPRPGSFPINNRATIRHFASWAGSSSKISEALDELQAIADLSRAGRYGSKRILIDPSVIRGLEYYTGPVYEVELLLETKDEKGRPVRFGSVGGGGRYDGLIARFRGQAVPATGFSIGVSRLQAALQLMNKLDMSREYGPVLVTVLDRDRVDEYQRMVSALRNKGIRAELYLGSAKDIRTQLKYADKRNSPCAVIQGSDERAMRRVLIKDLIFGAHIGELVGGGNRAHYLHEQTHAQLTCSEEELPAAVEHVLARHKVTWNWSHSRRAPSAP
ncbi:histidine--tRNA ligase [Bradyrhizobium sp. 138]|uniref:histidine--tRNA ligase n=1 Tax=Bradyrhizobium sp. 138 TaxID=2782615 RepID=UPI001FF7A3EC|nr:histidine--tRNA ligase [Bradyrhizobium sp. 138]MCK1737380.1 histidine--tRNA ligase [Bradyrhizobium sp. 138]